MPEIVRHISTVQDVPWTTLDVEGALREGKALAFGLKDDKEVLGFWIVRIENGFAKKFGVIWICAGRALEEGLPVYKNVIEPWLFDQGCEFIEIQGRKGWGKILPDYEETARVFVKRR